MDTLERGYSTPDLLFLPSFPVHLSSCSAQERFGVTTHMIEGLDGCELRIGVYCADGKTRSVISFVRYS